MYGQSDPGLMQSSNEMPGVSSLQNPGGNPQQGGDPLEKEAEICIAVLERYGQDLIMQGDEQNGNMIKALANRVAKVKINRRKEIAMAANKGMVPVLQNML